MTLAAACSYPDFQFRDDSGAATGPGDTTPGTGGQGGASTSVTVGQGGRMTTSTGMGGAPQTTASSSNGETTGTTGETTGASTTATTAAVTTGPQWTVPCAGSECPPGEICCIDYLGAGIFDECDPEADCTLPFFIYACNNDEDCPDQFCCGTDQGADHLFEATECKSSCLDDGTHYRMCAQSADCTEEPKTKCWAAAEHPDFGYCDVP